MNENYNCPIDIPGWMGDEELTYLYNMARNAPSKALLVELGAWKGRSTAALYAGMNGNQKIVTVDTWLGQADLRYEAHSEVLTNDIFLEFLDYMEAVDYFPEWYAIEKTGAMYLRMYSIDAATLFADGSIDRLFIDSDHGAVGEDIDVWRPKMKADGIICGHDYNWPGVKDQVEERFPITAVIGDLWVSTNFR